MASDIFRNIIEQKIDVFASSFGDSASNIFTIGNKLIHPLEYGIYKERCAKELLSYTTNKNIGISDGFIISANNNVSTQCDIIMYQNNTLPMIDNGITNFYPIEIIKGIGEVKSNLNRKEFKKALVKMAANKKMFLDRKGTLQKEKANSCEFDEIFSFLICNKLAFNIESIDYDDIYADVPDIRMRHNIILSLQDGCLAYCIEPSKFPAKQKEHFLAVGGIKDANPFIWPYPHHTQKGEIYVCSPIILHIDENDKYKHIISFLTNIRSLLKHQKEYEFDFVEYLNENIARLIERK